MPAPADTTDIFKKDLFAGKVVLVSGGGSGICRGLTEALLRHGAKAAIVSRTLSKLQKAAEEMSAATGGSVLPVAADVRKPDQVEAAVAKTMETYGRIDFLINGAAGNFLAPFEGLSYNAFRTVIEIDTLGTYNFTKAALPHLKASKGAVLNISATLHYTGKVFQLHVGAAKAAIDALTTHWAVELGPHGIRVNGISPGLIADTEGANRLAANFDAATVPLQRVGNIKDIEQSAVFLFSEAASYITGVTLVVDGGQWLTGSNYDYPNSVLHPPPTRRNESKM